MPPTDPFRPLRKWRSTLFRGDASELADFVQNLDANLPAGWSRDLSYELQSQTPTRVRCYLFDQVGDAAVRVWLQLVTPTRLRAGSAQLLRHSPDGNEGRIGELVADFVNGYVLPTAKASGVLYTNPSFGPRSFVTGRVENMFTQLADAADGQWPLDEFSQQLWEELISSCLSEQVAIDQSELAQWLIDSGWEQADVPNITKQFFADSEWFAKRLMVLAP